jgi:uncharacterized protein (DUF433 family)
MNQTTPTLVLTRYIDTVLFGRRPHIRGRRIPVAAIAFNARENGWDVPRLTREFSLTQAEVLAALLYYEEHHKEIDTQEEAYQSELDDAHRQNGE